MQLNVKLFEDFGCNNERVTRIGLSRYYSTQLDRGAYAASPKRDQSTFAAGGRLCSLLDSVTKQC